MTTGDTLRHWALALRALLEQTGQSEVVVSGDRGEYRYRMGEGLTLTVGGETVELPEVALDEERWMVAS